ncbi:MAG: hypothetical protein H6662_14150 [Ardenticatenaceae bacterium]|nr:hypothetical protein [Ardenticatenaceae bacterium]MCB9003570.1 hypothetical protein [Ardenticatenaceae bacterium]
MNTAVPLRHNMDLSKPIPASLLFATTYKQAKATGYLSRAGYDKALSSIVTAHGGLVLQVSPDKVVALFANRDLTQQNAAHQAITAALSLVDQIAMTNEYRLAAGNPAIHLGIGISTGVVTLEQTSNGLQISNSAGNALLNLAQQISDLNQQTPFPAAFISDETYHSLLSHNSWHVENLGQVWLPAHSEAQTIHAVMRHPQFQ